ncbi:MAG: DNA replication/repair protein RecF [Defluviitaleaceae bacterium]|nr:DNA replication/repair protein RecF [Defluviitaleaceae bacterium]
MHIKNISATGFRNLEIKKQQLSREINVIYGDNAQGKTNLIEVIYFCAFGRSLRAKSDSELVAWGSTEAFIRLETERLGVSSTIDASLGASPLVTSADGSGNIVTKSRQKFIKSISIDCLTVKHIKDLFGNLLIVVFSPEDLRLVKSGPLERRRFMDMEICQLFPVYYSDLREYHRALKQRNALLKMLQKDRKEIESLSIWDEQLIKYGAKITKTRAAFMKKISGIAAEIHKNIAKDETLVLEYKPSIIPEDLSRTWERDIFRGTTGEGVHRDDIDITLNGMSVRGFGSQGQQRTAALSAKLAEIELIKQSKNETPILLLDDVFSELDKKRQGFLLEYIKGQQTIITCTGIEELGFKNHNLLKMEGGQLNVK